MLCGFSRGAPSDLSHGRFIQLIRVCLRSSTGRKVPGRLPSNRSDVLLSRFGRPVEPDVFIQNWHGGLQNDGAAIQLLVDEVNCTPAELDTMVQRLLLHVIPGNEGSKEG